MKIEKSIPENTSIVTYQSPQPAIAKYLIVVINRGMTSEVDYFNSLKEAKRAFGEIVHDYGYKLSKINSLIIMMSRYGNG